MPKANESTTPYIPGDSIAAKYRLEKLLGEGGMGTVWAAHNVALDSRVAIKLIRGETDREALSVRLHQEARAAARLGHPAIVRVFDIGQTERGEPFIVMELLEGESLAAKLERAGRLSGIEVVQIMLPIADALRAAHAKGIVHRDIKPDNIFVAIEGDVVQPKLVDFGIAKLEQATGTSQLTQHGVVVGSPDYMSPEQARGDDVIDYRTDVWAFSVVLYEAVTGRLPFDAQNYNALLRSIVEDTPPSLLALAAGDAELSHIVAVGLSKNRDERWRSMQELGVALAAWLKHRGVVEDVVGASLDAKWLNRRSDPAGRASRPSLGSIPDGAFSPASGVAMTVRAPRPTDSATPEPPPQTTTASGVARWAKFPRVAVLAAAALVMLGVLYNIVAKREPPPEPPVPLPATAAPELVPELPAPSPTRVDVPEPPPARADGSSNAPEVSPDVSAPPQGARRPVPQRNKPAPASSTKPPSSDLIAPY
ncbi:MAG TPA: protein kinase [Polyangiaceae bacterium]